MTEAQWQARVLDLAKLCGWRVAHFRPARTATGWRTAVEADGVGYPDLTMVRDGRLLFVELKSETGRVATSQREWLSELSAVPGLEVYLWRPSDWAKVQQVLARDPLRMAGGPISGHPLPSDRYVLRPFSPRSGLTDSDQPGGVTEMPGGAA